MIDLTPIFNAIIALIAAFLTYKVLPWIKAKTTNEQQKGIAAVVRTLVFAAEQLYGAGNGDKKLEYVKDELFKRGYKLDRAEIESAVKQMTNELMSIGELVIEEETTIEK